MTTSKELPPGPWETSAGYSAEYDVEWQVCEPGGGDMIARVADRGDAEALAKAIAKVPAMLKVLQEYAEQIIDDPEGPAYRACCGARFSYVDIGKWGANAHARDCAAYSIIKELENPS